MLKCISPEYMGEGGVVSQTVLCRRVRMQHNVKLFGKVKKTELLPLRQP